MGQGEEWRYRARCAGEDTEQWFPPRYGGVYVGIADRARAVCRGGGDVGPCPVIIECLQSALDRGDPHGIWGGLSQRERSAMVRTGEVPDFLRSIGRSIYIGDQARAAEEAVG